jgi:dolichol-phosphate mannosyltransferase
LVNETYKDELNIKCFSHQGTRSLGASILEGIMRSSGSVIIGMDADFNHDPCLLPKLIESLDKYDIAVASRFIKGGGMENRLIHMLSLLFNLSLRLFFRYPIYDNTSGYYAIKKKALMRLRPERIYYGYGEYHMRLIYFSYKESLSIGEIPVWYMNRKHGHSKSNYCKMLISYFYAAFLLKWNYRNKED